MSLVFPSRLVSFHRWTRPRNVRFVFTNKKRSDDNGNDDDDDEGRVLFRVPFLASCGFCTQEHALHGINNTLFGVEITRERRIVVDGRPRVGGETSLTAADRRQLQFPTLKPVQLVKTFKESAELKCSNCLKRVHLNSLKRSQSDDFFKSTYSVRYFRIYLKKS